MNVVVLLSELLAPPLGSFLMESIGPHRTFILGPPLEFLGLLIIPFLCDEPIVKDDRMDASQEASEADSVEQPEEALNWSHGIRNKIQGTICYVRRDFISLLCHNSLLLGLLALSVHKVARPILELMLQYMSARFGWPLSRVSPATLLQA